MAKTTLGAVARKEMTALVVRAMYASFDASMLEEILAVGKKYEVQALSAGAREEVRDMNEALAELIEQRKAGQ